ncbi:hypothetical protein [Roseiconus lacunae]|uniref:Uncharacterized protein n=1 Tax=Roseiconus lacunae TaxID=2605694 RepID=A0ABT7PR26_9BACT|nr:hypothetical protein [Roseiconus lacunae]MDM4018960.1 hypothetical protein [Roseiconus lacunae]
MNELIIHTDGSIRTIYDESLDLAQFGCQSIRRASHVEPLTGKLWSADLSPVGGPILGPFPQRSEALAAERAWLSEHWLTPSQTTNSSAARSR